MPYSDSLPVFSTIEFIALVLIIYLLIRLIAKIISYVKAFSKVFTIIQKIRPLLDLAVVATIIFWLINKFFIGSELFSVMIAAVTIILLGLLGWFWGRDFVAGNILKSENYFEKNKKIQLNDKSGTIKKTNLRYLEFETDGGETIRVPYSKISSESFSKLSPDEKYESHLISIPLDKANDTEIIGKKIRQRIYNSPWYLAGKEPSIEIVSSDEGTDKINLTVYTLNPSHAEMIKRDLMELAGER